MAEVSPYHFKEAPGIGSNNGAIGLMNNQPHPTPRRFSSTGICRAKDRSHFDNANNTQRGRNHDLDARGSAAKRRAGSGAATKGRRLYRNQPARLDGVEARWRSDYQRAAEVRQVTAASCRHSLSSAKDDMLGVSNLRSRIPFSFALWERER